MGQVQLTPGAVVQGSVTPGAWAYYLLTLPPRVSISSVTVAVHEVNSRGLVWVYVSFCVCASL